MLSLDRAASAAKARIVNRDAFPAALRIVTDTRALQAGDTFLALRGERFDGHAYLQEALAKGASALVVDDAGMLPEGAAALVVADTKRAYMDLAGAARDLFTGRAVAITGSAGKTTTKHLIAQLLCAAFGAQSVLASPANENNEIGVSKLLLGAGEQHRLLVIEMGARHEGEIAELVDIARPQFGVLTNIGEAHLEIFGSRERLARTKWGLFSQGAQAIVNARDSESALRAASLPQPPLWFGAGDPLLPGVWVADSRTLVVDRAGLRESIAVDVRLPGQHNHANLAAALAAALALDAPLDALVQAIPGLTLPPGRYELIHLAGGARIIYDAYNANASGMIAALTAFAGEPAERRIAVLGSMAELGADAPAMHERVGAHAAHAGVDVLLVGGEYASSLIAGAIAAGFPRERIEQFEDNAAAVHWLRDHAGTRDAVLLKGSRKYKMEEIVSALQQTGANRV